MITPTVTLDLRGAEQLGKSGLRKAFRIAINRAASPVKAAEVSQADTIARYRFLARSIRIRLRVYPNDRFFAVIGPKSKFEGARGKFKRGKRKGQPRKIKPAKYAHLVNKGTKRSKGRHWLEKAYAASVQRFYSTVIAEIRAEILRQLAAQTGT